MSWTGDSSGSIRAIVTDTGQAKEPGWAGMVFQTGVRLVVEKDQRKEDSQRTSKRGNV